MSTTNVITSIDQLLALPIYKTIRELCRTDRRAGRRAGKLNVEPMESRNLPSAVSALGLLDVHSEVEPNDTLDAAQDLGSLSASATFAAAGAIGGDAGFSSDVDWFQFSLTEAAQVHVETTAGPNGAVSPIVLTLYKDETANFDPLLPLGHRRLAHSEGGEPNGAAEIAASLEPGLYFIAVSGAGNRFFHPFLADSGSPGVAASYGLLIRGDARGQAPQNSELAGTSLLDNSNDARPILNSAVPDPGLLEPGLETLSNDDTPATATDLGDVTSVRGLQVPGVIGDDPFYNFESEDPFAFNPAADVDMVHFQISGAGDYALVAEAFAGRIGSPLDSALTLFRTDESGALQLVATNSNTLNPIESTNGMIPLYSDAAIFAGLTAGDYFLAVSSSGNDPEWGPDGVFDPQIAHSGLNGGVPGAYVLDLLVIADADVPQVAATTPAEGSTLDRSPTHIEIQFSEPVNARQLAQTAFQQAGANTVRSVFVLGEDGSRYFPRLQSFDAATGVARFLMLDGLPNGDLELHVSGADGLTDLAGHPIAGNDASGDFVVRFSVDGPVRGHGDDPTVWLNQPAIVEHVCNVLDLATETGTLETCPTECAETAQDLGVLFPHELQGGVTLIRDAATNASQPADTADFFRFELLQMQSYFLTLTNTGGGDAPVLEVLNGDGQVVPLASQGGSGSLLGFLRPGTYVLHVGDWDAARSGDVNYQVEIELGGVSENPTPLTSGAAPAVGIRLYGAGSMAAPLSGPPHLFVRSNATGQVGTPASGNDIGASVNRSADRIGLISRISHTGPTGSGTRLAAETPAGLLQGLEASPLGSGPDSRALFAGTPDQNAIVRLMGFDRVDRLFALLDASVPGTSERPVESGLSTSDLSDIWAGTPWGQLWQLKQSATQPTPAPVVDELLSVVDRTTPLRWESSEPTPESVEHSAQDAAVASDDERPGSTPQPTAERQPEVSENAAELPVAPTDKANTAEVDSEPQVPDPQHTANLGWPTQALLALVSVNAVVQRHRDEPACDDRSKSKIGNAVIPSLWNRKSEIVNQHSPL